MLSPSGVSVVELEVVWDRVWAWDCNTEVAKSTVITLLNQMASVTLSTYLREPCSASSSCDTIVIPFQEYDTEPNSSSLSLFLVPPQEGRTALIWALRNGHINVVEKLLEAGANVNRQDEVRNLVI